MRIRTLALLLLVTTAFGCGGATGRCPAGMHWDDCAHGSCPNCDDCVEDCAVD